MGHWEWVSEASRRSPLLNPLPLSHLPFLNHPIRALLILGMKKGLYARNVVSIHTAFQQRLRSDIR
jgi:hypothetical protein